jgi:hypothetical protein
MRVYTSPNVAKEAYRVLNDVGLGGLLSGAVQLNLEKTISALLEDGKLNDFCQIITKTEVDFGEMEMEDIAEVVSDFFSKLSSALRKVLPGAALQVQSEKEKK